MKYYLDEDLDPGIAVAARSLDVVSAHECGARAMIDAEQCTRAAESGRCIVNYNRNDFIAVTRQAYDKGQPHYGVLLIPPQLRYSRHGLIAKALAAHSGRFGHGDFPPYSIDYLKAPDPS